MRVGINQSCIMQARMEEFLRACGNAEIAEVELRVPKLQEVHYHLDAAAIKDLLDQNRMIVTAINSLEDFGLVPDGNMPILRREVETMVDFCRTCGCSLVVAPVARWFEERTDRGWITETTAKRLRYIADILGDAGIEVGLEPIAFESFTVWSLEHAAEIKELSGAKNVSLVADVYNLARGESTPTSMQRFGSEISMIHVNDSPSDDFGSLDLVHDRTFPGEGVLRPEEWVQQAQAGGFAGWCSIEIFPEAVWSLETSEAARLCASKCDRFGQLLGGQAQ